MTEISKVFDNFKETLLNVATAFVEHFTEIASGLVVFLLFLVLSRTLAKNIGKLLGGMFKKYPVIASGIRTSVKDPFHVFFIILGLYLGFVLAAPPATFMASVTKGFRIANIVLLTWGLANFAPFITSTIIHFEETTRRSNAVAVRFVANMFKIVVISISVVIVIGELGYNIGGLLTGIGLGGLTFSLAAQSTASDLFAGFSIVADKPFDVGDYIITSSVEGVVEDITMRSTRIRTLADTVMVVPNSKLVNETITNYAKLNRRYVDYTIGLTYGTDLATVRNVVEDIKTMLYAHPMVLKERIVVAFTELASSSQEIRIVFSMDTKNFDESLEIREDINFRIKEIVESDGASFAFPSVTVYHGDK